MKVYILIDRSGSMASRWDDVMPGVRTHIGKLAPKTKVTIVSFDDRPENVVLDSPPVDALTTLGLANVCPRGSTALYDAIAHLAGFVAETAKKKAQILIVTDGHENASKKTTLRDAHAIVEKWQGKGYDVIYLGADLKDLTDAVKLGVSAGATMSINTRSMGDVADVLRSRTMAYASSGQTADFTAADRVRAAGKAPKGVKNVKS